MMKRAHHRIGLLSTTFFLFLANAPVAQETTVYQGFTAIDPSTETVIEDSFLVVQGERIALIGTGAAPTNASWTYVDMSGRYALPGMIDAHAHITTGPTIFETTPDGPVIKVTTDDDITRFHALVALAFGVTTIRNPAGNPVANAEYSSKIAGGLWLGPETLHAGLPFNPELIDGMFVHPQSPAEWERAIERHELLDMSYVKLYTGLTEDELALAISIARAHGLKTIAHLDRVSWMKAIELGVDALTHMLPTSEDLLVGRNRDQSLESRDSPDSKFMYRWFELVDYNSAPVRELVEALVANRAVVDLTLVVNELAYFFDDLDALVPADDRKYAHPRLDESWFQMMSASHFGWIKQDYARAHDVMPKVLELAGRLHDAGVPMLIGKDGTGGGPFFTRELSFHEEAEIPAWSILQMITNLAAEMMGSTTESAHSAKDSKQTSCFSVKIHSNPCSTRAVWSSSSTTGRLIDPTT